MSRVEIPLPLNVGEADLVNGSTAPRVSVRYGLALGVTGAAAIGAAKLLPVTAESFFYLPLTVAIIISAWFGGVGPALFSQICGAAFAFSFLARSSPFSQISKD